jgi:hypothetical protein
LRIFSVSSANIEDLGDASRVVRPTGKIIRDDSRGAPKADEAQQDGARNDDLRFWRHGARHLWRPLPQGARGLATLPQIFE